MPTIHLIDGEKGGVGKSFVTRAMIQYGLDRNFPFVAVGEQSEKVGFV